MPMPFISLDFGLDLILIVGANSLPDPELEAMSRCQYLDVNQKPICGKRVLFGGHHCRHCQKFICNDHTEGMGEQKYCRNKTCFTPEEVATLSIENMSKLSRESRKFHSKPLFGNDSNKEQKKSEIASSSSKASKPENKSIQTWKFFLFVGITSLVLQIYFPERIQTFDSWLQQGFDYVEILAKPYQLDFYLYYLFVVCRIVYLWMFLFLVLTYAFFKTL